MYENLTPEQSDALILEALSPSSGTNEQEQYEDAPESTEEVEEETEEVQETESDEDGEDSEPEQPKERSKNSNVPKLVAQRNEARREAQELRKQLAEINKAKLNEKYDPESISDFSTISDESAMSIYKQWRFLESKGLDLDEVEDVMAMSKELNVPVERALNFYLAEHNPKALLDTQTVAKSEAKKYSVSWVTNRKPTKVDIYSEDYQKDFDKAVREGRIRI